MNLSQEFLKTLYEGGLFPIIQKVKEDESLSYEIWENQVHVYYRERFALKLIETENGFAAEIEFDPDFYPALDEQLYLFPMPALPAEFSSDRWLERLPIIKSNIHRDLSESESGEPILQILLQTDFVYGQYYIEWPENKKRAFSIRIDMPITMEYLYYKRLVRR